MTQRPNAADFNRFFRGGTYGNYDIFTARSYREFVESNDIDLSLAINRFDGSTLIGTLAYGIRGDRAWFGLIGVAQAARRQGLGGELVDAAVTEVCERGVRRIELEIVQRNRAAREMVFARGFAPEEELAVWARGTRAAAGAPLRARTFTADEIAALSQRAACWQREPRSVARAGTLALVEVDGAHAFVRERGHHALVADAHAETLDAARALLAELDARVGSEITLNNEPAGSSISRACDEFGWRVVERQHRIVWPAQSERA